MDNEQKAHTIEISKEFSVPVEDLFQAWTEVAHLKEWWHPMDDSLEDVKNELQEGGAVEYDFKSKDFRVIGTYKEVEANKKLVYSWDWKFEDNLINEEYVLTVTFESTENGSSLHVLQEGLSAEEVIPPHEEAWRAGLESLKSYLEKSQPENAQETKEDTEEQKPEGTESQDIPQNENLKSSEGQSDRSGGYNESPDQAKVGGG